MQIIMLNLLNYEGEIVVNGQTYASSHEAYESLKSQGLNVVSVVIPGRTVKPDAPTDFRRDCKYQVRVKSWMREYSSPAFDFMQKWNDDVPMPLAVMQGYVLEETAGMVRMSLEGSVSRTVQCMVCGRALKNKLSQQYGIGPECAEKVGIERIPKSADEVEDLYDSMQKQMQNVTWEGWIAKKAIVEKLVIE